MVAFCPRPKKLPGAELKSNGLIALAEDISRESSIESVVWLLMLNIMPIYSENGNTGEKKNAKCTV